MGQKVIPKRDITLARRGSNSRYKLKLFHPEKDAVSLRFKDAEVEATYTLDHGKRMSRGFRSSTLTRVGMFVLVGLLYLTLFEGEADSSFFASMGAVVVDVLLILVHQLKIVPAKYMQTVCCISCAVEGRFWAKRVEPGWVTRLFSILFFRVLTWSRT
jgi:hypothetical protein